MKLVTCIMPTRGRGPWAAQAVNSFLRQSYPNKQLLILDDADEPSFPEAVLLLQGVAYLRLDDRLNIPQKRNLLCRFAAGEIIAHFDSDDWSVPERIADQVERLDQTGVSVTGYHSILFTDQDSRWGRYVGDVAYALGSSLCYYKKWWQRSPFDESKTIGEDNDFVYQARNAQQFISVEGPSMMVARVHPGNTSAKNVSDYRPVEPSMIPVGFLE